jgi:hypothetical protein
VLSHSPRTDGVNYDYGSPNVIAIHLIGFNGTQGIDRLNSRSIVLAVVAATSVLFSTRDVLANGATNYYSVISSKASGLPRNFARAKGRGHQTAPWAFYADLSYYADPEYFLRCYQRTRIETLYWVSWRSVRVCK